MAKFDNNRFASANQEYETPDWLFNKLNDEFQFTRDVCASESNKKCDLFWSCEDSCLEKTWSGVNWMNPPYNMVGKFVKKAYEQRYNAVTVCLIPARTNTRWWHKYCMNGEVRFICGRPKFIGCTHGLPQPLAIVVFGKQEGIMTSFYI